MTCGVSSSGSSPSTLPAQLPSHSPLEAARADSGNSSYEAGMRLAVQSSCIKYLWNWLHVVLVLFCVDIFDLAWDPCEAAAEPVHASASSDLQRAAVGGTGSTLASAEAQVQALGLPG